MVVCDPDIVAERLFGQHMHGFLVLCNPDKVDEPDIFIKDAWSDTSKSAHNNPDCNPRDKVALVQEVSRMLAEDPCDNDPPFIVFKHGGLHIVESTAAVLGPIFKDIKKKGCQEVQPRHPRHGRHEAETMDMVLDPFPFCIHKHIAMSPISQLLMMLESPYELIIVLANVMCAHMHLLECGILHRDISVNNILVIRGPGNIVHGLLTDLDCAIRVGMEWDLRPEHTRMPPFMNIMNLMNSSMLQSELDDWESVLYIACWLGIYGISKVDHFNCQTEMNDEDDWGNCLLGKLDAGSFEDIVTAKRAHVGLLDKFDEAVIFWFMDGNGYKALKKLLIAAGYI
ncbi:hypothetical protein LPJ61_002241 [Coemansia biformis]|uniref:Fungal-type protein kinase domain-containing protein n=1 Tax=Coemansia biformis TaxID=1286918 RepID=A0A9W8CZU9_9FUNG|nr:hypothetical protein LPJ61_002241 [Coemansia biformis]